FDARATGQAQFVVAHGLVEALAQQAVQDFVAHLLAEALLDDLRRHLAGAETLDAGRARDLAQAPADLVLEALRRQAERHATTEIAQGFNRRTCIYSWHTHSCDPRGLRGMMLEPCRTVRGPRGAGRTAERASFADSGPGRQRE